MIHYSCDRCKRMIDPAHEVRYLIKIETHAVLEPVETDEPDDDRDHLTEIHDALADLDLDDEDCAGDEPQRLSFDLCGPCYRRYLQDPLATETLMHVGFSHN